MDGNYGTRLSCEGSEEQKGENSKRQLQASSSRIPIPARRCKLNATQTGAAGYAGSEQRHHRRAAAALGLLVRDRARTRARARVRATEYY